MELARIVLLQWFIFIEFGSARLAAMELATVVYTGSFWINLEQVAMELVRLARDRPRGSPGRESTHKCSRSWRQQR